MRTFEPCVYSLADRYRGAMYTGVTSDMPARIYQHREETFGGFTSRYNVKRLVWFERHDAIEIAIRREKTIKRWPRQWKFNVIEEHNPDWGDLAEELGLPPLEKKK
jgi:putative endonuclease